MPEKTGNRRGTVRAAAAAIVQVALVVLVVVGAGWTLLKIAQWRQADAKAGKTPPVQPASQPGSEVETHMIVLSTPFALIHGDAKMVPKGENSYVDDWKRLDDWIQWRFDVKTPGEYEVVVEYACEAANSGSRYTVTVDEQSLSGQVLPTGKSWIEVGVGRATFEEAGYYTLSIKPQYISAATVMRLKRIVLRPTA